ncbi:MAG: biotin/lipoyl-binding protein [Anaerolineae bacterium]|nr:biotin/lipoyl-binding protein [Anaerolineae bacterium]
MNKKRNKLNTLAGLLVAVVVLAACQDQTQPTTTTTDPAQNTGRGRRATPVAGGEAAPAAGAAAPAQPTALPTRVVVANTTLTVDGVLALGGPLMTMSFSGNGKVAAVNVSPGQAVKKGDVLAELDSTSLGNALQLAQEQLVLKQAQINSSLAPSAKTELDTARASLASAYAAYAEAKKGPDANTVEQALRSWNQAKNSLYSSQLNRDATCATDKESGKCKQAELGVQSAEINERSAYQKYVDSQAPTTPGTLTQSWSGVLQAQASLAKLQYNVSAEDKQVYDLQLASAQKAVERAQRNLAQAKLTSPCDCKVQEVTMSAGGAGGNITLLDVAQVQFHTTNLNERDVVNLQQGQAVMLRLKAFGQTFVGKVGNVLPVSSGSLSGVALYTAIVTLDPTDAELLPGMTGQAEITLK